MSGFSECEEHRPTEAQKVFQPVEQEAEVVTCGSEDGVDGIARGVGKMVAAHAMFILDVANDGFNAGTAIMK